MERPIPITTNEQLVAVASDNRLAVLRLLMAGPASLSQLGRSLGKHAAWVRYHVKELEKAGLVRLAETRRTRNYVEHLYRATASAYTIHTLVTPQHGPDAPLVVLGSHDLALELVTSLEADGEVPPVLAGAVGSLDGLIALRQGLADVAGCHLLDADTGVYNEAHVRHLFPDRDILLVTLAEREQGLFVPAGNPKGLSSIEDLAGGSVRFVNRNAGSGTRVWLDRKLHDLRIPADSVSGYSEVVNTHTEAAEAVARGAAEASIGIRAAAERLGVGFVPLFDERYDLVLDAERLDDDRVQALLGKLEDRATVQAIGKLGGYDTSRLGAEKKVSLRP